MENASVAVPLDIVNYEPRPSIPLENDGYNITSRKRKLPLPPSLATHQATFPRKRSAVACELCRQRKTKCDNSRPSCSKCSELGAQCSYQDQGSCTSPASQILDRLEYLIGLVESGVSNTSALTPVIESRTLHNDVLNTQSPLSAGAQLDESTDVSQTGAKMDPFKRDIAHEKHMAYPGQEYFGSSESILGWPIFGDKYDRRWLMALIFDPTPCDDLFGLPTSPSIVDDSTRNQYEDPRLHLSVGPGISEEDVPNLVEIFLLHVHVKNPILDQTYLRKMAKRVVEDGFDWKASSCLVLIVCALAAISPTFTHQSIYGTSAWQEEEEDSLSVTTGYYTAESYYSASLKRVGLLKNTLLATECYFMIGVYEMYSLRPLQAAISFNRACVTFQTLIWMNSEYYISESQLGKARASRLYWSCLKSEHEVSVEIRFPSSGLTKLKYTSSFPSPPSATTSETLQTPYADLDIDTNNSQPDATKWELERGWYYYLADIAARRILQRVIKYFYETKEGRWLDTSLPQMLQTAEELDRQLKEWYRALPDAISFDIDLPAQTELAYHLQARAFEIEERIYRPFLYFMVHKSLESSERDCLLPLVRLHSTACCHLIQQWNIRHRHHGTWLMAKQSFTAALLLLAAKISGVCEISEQEFQVNVQTSLATLRFWEIEAPDLKASRLILEDIRHHLNESMFEETR